MVACREDEKGRNHKKNKSRGPVSNLRKLDSKGGRKADVMLKGSKGLRRSIFSHARTLSGWITV